MELFSIQVYKFIIIAKYEQTNFQLRHSAKTRMNATFLPLTVL